MEGHARNLMSADNLAVIFAPTLLRSPETDPVLSIATQCHELELMMLLIVHQTTLLDTVTSLS